MYQHSEKAYGENALKRLAGDIMLFCAQRARARAEERC